MSISRDKSFKFFKDLPVELQTLVFESSDAHTLESLTATAKSISNDTQYSARISQVVMEILKDCLLIFKILKSPANKITLPKLEEIDDMTLGLKQLYIVFYDHFELKNALPSDEEIIHLASLIDSQSAAVETKDSWPATDTVATHWFSALQTIGELKKWLLQKEFFYRILSSYIDKVCYTNLDGAEAVIPGITSLLKEFKIAPTESKHTPQTDHDTNELLKQIIKLICETKNMFCVIPSFMALVYGKKIDLMQILIHHMKKYDTLPLQHIHATCSSGLVSAAFFGHFNMVQALIPHCKNIPPLNKIQSLLNAIDRNHLETIKLLLADLDLDINGTGNCTNYMVEKVDALTLAAYLGRTEIVKLLIAAKADPTREITFEGQTKTALQFAEQNNHAEVASLIKIYEKEWQLKQVDLTYKYSP